MFRPGRTAAWAAATLLGILVTFAPAVVGSRTLAHRDTDRLYAPIRPLVVEALREGRLPLWNPYEAAGKPLFEEGVHSVLHPVSLLGALLAPTSIDFLVLGYLALAALGAFTLARVLGASPPAAAAAGLGFGLAGFTVSMTGNLVFLAGSSALPWVVAAARWAGAGAPFGPVAAALAAAVAFLAGDAQAALVGLALGLALAADAGGWRGVARALAGLLAGTLLAGVQIAATQGLLPQTLRGGGLATAGDWSRWPLAPWRLLEWVVPGLSRGPLTDIPRDAVGRNLEMDFAESVHLGAPLLLAAALGARRRTGLLLAGAFALLTWMALGHHLGARPTLDWVPVWGRFRYTEKLMGPLSLCAAVLAALGVDAFGARRLGRGATRALLAVAVSAGAALSLLLAFPEAAGRLAIDGLGPAGRFYRDTLTAGLPHLLLGLLATLLVDRLVVAGPARAVALTLAVAGSAAAAAYHGAFLGDPALRVPWNAALEADGPSPRLAWPVEGRYPDWWRLPYVDAHARSLATRLIPAANVGARVDALGTYCGFDPRRFTALAESLGSGGARFWRRFGLTHLVVAVPVLPAEREVYEFTTEGGRLLERDEPLGREVWAVPHRPWAFFATAAEAWPRPEEAHRRLLDLIDLRADGTVVVEAAASPPAAPGRVLAVERAAERVVVEAEAAGPALLVVQDAWWPGWQATVDGRPAELLPADVLVRAVHWPAGRHRLEMIYDPPSLRVGWALTGIGGALVLLFAALAARRWWRERLNSSPTRLAPPTVTE